MVIIWEPIFNSQKKLTSIKESKEVTNKDKEMKRNLVRCKIWICEKAMPNKTFNRHNLENRLSGDLELGWKWRTNYSKIRLSMY